MANKSTTLLLSREYGLWLAANGINATSQSSYIMHDVEQTTQQPYFDIIASFLFHYERMYAYAVLEDWGKRTAGNKNKHSYWKKYRRFIRSIVGDVHRYINPAQVLTDKQLEPVRKLFNKKGLIRLDGMEALVDILGESTFIKHAIETSFFFDSDAAYNRFVQMRDVITHGKPDALFPKSGAALPARKTNNGTHVMVNGTMWLVDVNGNTICPIIEDDNGNSKPHSMINTLFGYNQNVVLEDKPFRNYITSHIWGQATDPRYFTSLWNIALVPAWVNHLLDKTNVPAGALESTLRATFMEICAKHNNLNDATKYNWGTINIGVPTAVNPQDIHKGTYDIQVIMQKQAGAKYGKIVTKKVKI